ncbi:MAG: type IIL restriction-modification enzyme MmeI [Sulfurimonas sp.]|jgi:hypothetical protein
MVVSWNEIKKAHQELDKVMDKCYKNKNFKNGKECVAFLFELYEEYLDG